MRYLRTLALIVFVVVGVTRIASAQWTLIDSLRLGGLPDLSELVVDSSGYVYAYDTTLYIFDPVSRQWSEHTLPGRLSSLAASPTGSLVALFNTSTIGYSSDRGASWSMDTSTVIKYIRDVVWNDTLLLAAGGGPFGGLMHRAWSETMWHRDSTDLPPGAYNGIHATDQGHFILGSDGAYFESSDGLHWDSSARSTPNRRVRTYFVTRHGTLLGTGVYRNIVFRSSDWGTTWDTVALFSGLVTLDGFFPLNGNAIAVGAQGDGYSISEDDGVTWSPLQSLPGQTASAMLRTHGNLIASTPTGTFELSRGHSWSAIDSGTSRERASAIGSLADTVFVTTATRGVYRSFTTPTHWLSTDSAYSALGQYAVGRGQLYSMTSDGLLVWYGANWKRLPRLFQELPPVTYTRSTSGRLFAATSQQFFYLTTDSSWRTVLDLFGQIVRVTAADSAGNVFALVGRDSIVYSQDDGNSWSELPGRPIGPRVLSMLAEGDTLVVVTDSAGLYLSADLGSNWSNVPYPVSAVRTANVFEGRYFLNTGHSLYERDLHDAAWQLSSIDSQAIYGVTISANGHAFVSAAQGIYSRMLPHTLQSVSVRSPQTSPLTVTPNPVTAVATLSEPIEGDLTDLVGHHIANVNGETIDCSAYPAGLYVLRSRSGQTAKVLIVR